jgi:hypothetical protein
MKNPTSCLNLCNHVISLVPSFTRFQYFTSIDESLTIVGCFKHWVIGDLPRMKAYPFVNLLVSPSPT